MKTIFFEGAGCVPCGDVENCRIRTAFRNKKGTTIYLELMGYGQQYKNFHDSGRITLRTYNYRGVVSYCHYITEDLDDCNTHNMWSELRVAQKLNYKYSKAGILNFVNTVLNGGFDEIKIGDWFDGYQVHQSEFNLFGGAKTVFKTGYDKYFLMEDFLALYNPEFAEARRNAFKKYDELYKAKTNSKYSILSIVQLDNETVSLRSYASDKVLEKTELPRNFTLHLSKDENGNIEYTPQRNGRLSDALI